MRVVARFVSALAVLSAVAFVAASCGGGMSASSAGHPSSLSVSCSARSDASSGPNLLWVAGKQPLVFYVHGRKVISSVGGSAALPQGAIPIGFRACSTPLFLYTFGTELRASALAGGRQTLTVGNNTAVAPDGRLLSFSGEKLGFVGGSSFVAHGLPVNWKITSVAVSPRDPHVFLAAAQSPEAGIETCGKGLGGIYRITPTGAKAVFVDNPCRDHPQAAFSPDGTTISYVGGPTASLYALDSSGSNVRRVTAAGAVTRYLWSPDGTRIAYGTKSGTVAVLTLASGAVHELGRGTPLAWSPDGHEVAVAAAGRPVIDAVPAAGGSSHVLLRLRKT
jgi:WD40 repeat protein